MPLIRCDKGDALSLLVQFSIEPWVPCAPPPASLLFSRLSGLAALLDQPFLFYVFFSFHPSLPRFPHSVYKSCAFFCDSSRPLRPHRFYPRSRSHSRPHLLFSFLSPLPSLFPSCVRPGLSNLVPVPVPVSILRSLISLHPLSRSRSCSMPVPAPDPVPISVPAPDSVSAPDLVRSFLSFGPGYPLGAMRVYRNQALRTELPGARKRYPLSAKMMTRAE